MSSLLPRRRSSLFAWGAAAFTAAALYGLPVALVVYVLDRSALGLALLALDLVGLVTAAVGWWSPLTVLAAAVSSIAGALAYTFLRWTANACSTSSLGWAGIAVLALGGVWGARRGADALWAIPVSWLAAGAWVVLASRLVHGGTAMCVD